LAKQAIPDLTRIDLVVKNDELLLIIFEIRAYCGFCDKKEQNIGGKYFLIDPFGGSISGAIARK
jgi:hypothetical protein